MVAARSWFVSMIRLGITSERGLIEQIYDEVIFRCAQSESRDKLFRLLGQLGLALGDGCSIQSVINSRCYSLE